MRGDLESPSAEACEPSRDSTCGCCDMGLVEGLSSQESSDITLSYGRVSHWRPFKKAQPCFKKHVERLRANTRKKAIPSIGHEHMYETHLRNAENGLRLQVNEKSGERLVFGGSLKGWRKKEPPNVAVCVTFEHEHWINKGALV